MEVSDENASVAGHGLAVILGGCAGTQIKPSAKNVKKLAIVSLYMNHDFYNIKSPRAGEGQAVLKSLVKGLVKEQIPGSADLLESDRRNAFRS